MSPKDLLSLLPTNCIELNFKNFLKFFLIKIVLFDEQKVL